MKPSFSTLQKPAWNKAIIIHITIISLGLMLRLGLSGISIGSNDITTWASFASTIDFAGLPYMYENVGLFNHPPLMGYLAKYALHISQTLNLPFAFIFKLPMILADVFTSLLLWNIWHNRRGPNVSALAVSAFAGSLVSILISAYHGNTDSLCAFLCLLAAYLNEKNLPQAGGLALGAALNVKLLPLVLIPAFAFHYRNWRDLLKFGVGLAVGVLPFVPVLICCGGSFARNVIGYNSTIDQWGIMLFLLQSGSHEAFKPVALQLGTFYGTYGRLVVMGLMMLLSLGAYWSNRWNMYEVGALCFAVFLIFTPGFGVQYLVYLCPLLFAVNLSWATLYSTLAGVFLAAVYYSFWTKLLPFQSEFTSTFPMPTPLVGLLVWMLLIQFVLQYINQTKGRPQLVSGDVSK